MKKKKFKTVEKQEKQEQRGELQKDYLNSKQQQ